MANTRVFNAGRNPDGSRPSKRRRTGIYHDRVPLDDDFEVIHSRETGLGAQNQVFETPRSPQKGRTFWSERDSWAPLDDTELGLDPVGDWYDEEGEEGIPEAPAPSKAKKPKSKLSKRPHIFWKKNHRRTYLDELVRWEGRGDFRHIKSCVDCVARKIGEPGAAEFRCLDCFTPDLVCSQCCIRRHRQEPFHIIERWANTHFLKTTLKELGLRVQLNHASMRCATPERAHANLRILHTNGIHDIAIDYCNCERAIPKHLQHLRRGFYPASQVIPTTCATFRLLSLLHLLALTSKASTYDFYRTLEKMTDNTGASVPKSRYRQLLRMVLQFRHLKMLKRGGVCHDAAVAADPAGIESVKPGAVAVLCPHCPRPGINLPIGWEKAPVETKYLYHLFYCMDANFRLKNQLVSSYSSDPGLGIGMAYMVARAGYEKYVLSRASDKDISTCVGFSALAKANTKFSKGLRYTGVGAVSCGRAEMVLPNSVGNLQKGERYANMDYVFGSAIRDVSPHLFVVISYDIACQWFKNLQSRINDHWPAELKFALDLKMRPQIPAFHEPGHGQAGHQEYSCKLSPGMGLSDGECPERIWSAHNALGNATKTQGPGSRQDVIDDHMGFWNWCKYNTMGKTLIRKYKVAVRERNVQVEGHRGFTATLPPALVKMWERMCETWERDTFPKGAENPFVTEGVCLTEAQIKKELAEEEESRLKAGGLVIHQTSMSSFLVLGLELEESQRRLHLVVKSRAAGGTARQEASLTELRNILRAKIRNWEQIQESYMPGLRRFQLQQEQHPSPEARALTFRAPPPTNHPEDVDLWLPSSLSTVTRKLVCSPSLVDMEEKLRTAQCNDALESIRHILRVKSRMVLFKNAHIRGQRDGTRSRSVIDRVHGRARAAAEKYRFSRLAKLSLAGHGDWEKRLQVLEDSDIRAYSDLEKMKTSTGRKGTVEEEEEGFLVGERGSVPTSDSPPVPESTIDLLPEFRTEKNATGQSRRTLSWIWRVEGFSVDSENSTDDILRAEWAKSRARAARSTEEVLLLREEMRRTLEFLSWKARWWEDRLNTRGDVADKGLLEGLKAYAHGQAAIQRSLHSSFQLLWKQPLVEVEEDEEDDTADDDKGNDDDEGSDDEL